MEDTIEVPVAPRKGKSPVIDFHWQLAGYPGVEELTAFIQHKGKIMKHKFDIKAMVFGTLLGAMLMFSIGAMVLPPPSREYKIISGRVHDLPSKLQEAAADGWEVVSAASDDGYPFVIMRKAK
jgi:hypothetical protein